MKGDLLVKHNFIQIITTDMNVYSIVDEILRITICQLDKMETRANIKTLFESKFIFKHKSLITKI